MCPLAKNVLRRKTTDTHMAIHFGNILGNMQYDSAREDKKTGERKSHNFECLIASLDLDSMSTRRECKRECKKTLQGTLSTSKKEESKGLNVSNR